MPSWQARTFSLFTRLLIKRGANRTVRCEEEAARLMRGKFEPYEFLIPPPPEGAKVRPVNQAGVVGEWVEWTDNPRRTIYYLHGGGYVACSPATHRGFTVNLSRAAEATVFALDYRRAPEHKFPAAVEDAVNGYNMLLEAGELPHNIVIGGDSAGGGLALATLIALRDRAFPLPAAAFCLSPWTDLTASGASVKTNADKDSMLSSGAITRVARLYYGNTSPTDPLVSPLFGDLVGLPPLLIYVSNTEVLLDDSVRLAERARKYGVQVDLRIWNNLPHVWPVFVGFKLPEAKVALGEIAEFIKQQTSGQQARRSAA